VGAPTLIFGIVVLVLVGGVPLALMVLLIYQGEKSSRLERERYRFFRRGFEVKHNTGPMPVPREKEQDHG